MLDFIVEIRSPIDRQLMLHALAAITAVWERHIGAEACFRAVFGERVIDAARPWAEVNGAFDPIGPSFLFAMSTMLRVVPERIWHAQVIRVAAHEAMHAIQWTRAAIAGGTFTPPQGDFATHQRHPLEVEAHRESVDVLKGYAPELTRPLPLGDRLYPLPLESSYREYWETVERDGAPFRIVSERNEYDTSSS